MSHTESCPDLKRPCMGEGADVGDDSADQNTQCVSSPDSNVRERVLKEVGLTSTTFIGPAFPPEKNTSKPGIEDILGEFYKELGEIDTSGGANGNSGQQAPPSPPKTAINKQTQDVHEEKSVDTNKSEETDGCRRGSGQKQPSWPHWYQNKPYYPRRPMPDAPTQNHWHYPQPLYRPPDPKSHTPPFHHPPPPPAFLNSCNPPPHVNPDWSSSVANQYPEESHLQTVPQDYYGDYPRHLDMEEQGCSYSAYPNSINTGWSRDREERYHCGEGYDRRQRYYSENKIWEQQHHCQTPDLSQASRSSLVLILMRGLPGSGKSTLARVLLSTGPNGLILSTDDYFAYKDGYHYEAGLLGVAHEWNQRRAKDAMYDCRSPIIIDNTNIQAWEMKPYVKMALERGYKVDFCEPDTSWKMDPYELEKRNKHGVTQEKIGQMLDRFSFPISIDIVMSSQEPPHVNQRRQPERYRR